jgi:hypothetical protein
MAEGMGLRMSNPGAETASPGSAEKRQPRQARLVKAALGCARLGRFDVTIRNVSATGIGGQAPQILDIGERMTVYLPGHEPMMGTVRWIADRRFGIETDRPVETGRLRGAHGDQLMTADSSIEFQIIPPPTGSGRRPALTLGDRRARDQQI